jgi:hypothetical protein
MLRELMQTPLEAFEKKTKKSGKSRKQQNFDKPKKPPQIEIPV